MDADDGFSLCFICNETIDFGDGSVEGNYGEAMVGHVEDEVLTHDGQANEAKISPGEQLLALGTQNASFIHLLSTTPWGGSIGIVGMEL
jgi:hypothetical protein